MPPVVTGAIVALIGLNLAPVAWGSCSESGCSGFQASPLTALVTLLTIVLATVFFRGIFGRLAILLGVVVGYLVAAIRGEIDFSAVSDAAWIGFPTFQTPAFDLAVLGLFAPVVFVLIAENVGHVKSVAAMTGRDLDPMIGKALLADGVATTLAGAGGGSGTTTYAENIGVMAATKVYSTALYWIAGGIAILLSFVPKFGEAIATIPAGVIGAAGTVLYGMIGLLGARIWIENKVSFTNPVNLIPAAVGLIMGIADFTFTIGDMTFGGVTVGTITALVLYHLMKALAKARGTAHPEDIPVGPADFDPYVVDEV
jgi:uracil-xanthine permease